MFDCSVMAHVLYFMAFFKEGHFYVGGMVYQA
jgi:hypothetical protein